jgi:hypothetical protein
VRVWWPRIPGSLRHSLQQHCSGVASLAVGLSIAWWFVSKQWLWSLLSAVLGSPIDWSLWMWMTRVILRWMDWGVWAAAVEGHLAVDPTSDVCEWECLQTWWYHADYLEHKELWDLWDRITKGFQQCFSLQKFVQTPQCFLQFFGGVIPIIFS